MTSQGRQAYCKVKGQSQSNKHLVEIVALYFSWVFPNCSLIVALDALGISYTGSFEHRIPFLCSQSYLDRALAPQLHKQQRDTTVICAELDLETSRSSHHRL
ncbi:hypothetical protein HBI82_045160 [Parastagonospora nodorum]|nr:hypothetical protein HBI82_045160 [Parastagonospora nodorum]